MAPEEIEQAFMTANPNLQPDNMAISCSNGELVDVRFCLAKDLSSYAVCRKVARHTCQRGSIADRSGALNAPRTPTSPPVVLAARKTERAVEWRDKGGDIWRLAAARTARLRVVKETFPSWPERRLACYKDGCTR